ncbi:hypothetical protein B0H11DRAFT_2229296 [Mycena galericulata]|nr:hypothetical protein B0H11DRAFT_2229296 [Mycena galericulata]
MSLHVSPDSEPTETVHDGSATQTSQHPFGIPLHGDPALPPSSIDWSNLDTLRRVVYLDVSGMHATHRAEVLVSVLQNAVKLEHLILSSPDINAPAFTGRIKLPALEKLEVGFGSDTDMGVLVGSFVMPALTTLSVALEGANLEGFRRCFRGRRAIFHRVSALSIRTPLPSPDVSELPRTLFKFFSSVISLDLSSADCSVLRGLVEKSAEDKRAGFPEGVLLPHLTNILLSADAIDHVKDFVDIRMHMPFQSLRRLHIQFRDSEEERLVTTRDDWPHILRNVVTISRRRSP